jgi:hypothetical protein
MMEKIDALVGAYGRAAFIRDAIAAELERRTPFASKPE